MSANLQRAVRATQHHSAVAVHRDARARVLTEILLKPRAGARRGEGETKVQQKRKHIQQGLAKPIETLLLCLDDNGRLDEFIDALVTLHHPGDEALSLADAVCKAADADCAMRPAENEFLRGRHSRAVIRRIYDEAEVLESAAHAIRSDAARELFRGPVQRGMA